MVTASDSKCFNTGRPTKLLKSRSSSDSIFAFLVGEKVKSMKCSSFVGGGNSTCATCCAVLRRRRNKSPMVAEVHVREVCPTFPQEEQCTTFLASGALHAKDRLCSRLSNSRSSADNFCLDFLRGFILGLPFGTVTEGKRNEPS